MTSITPRDFVANLLKLTSEVFEGPPAQGGSATLTGMIPTSKSRGDEEIGDSGQLLRFTSA